MEFANTAEVYFELMVAKMNQWSADPSPAFNATPSGRVDGSIDVFEWHCWVPGTANSLYKDGIFNVRLMFPRNDNELMCAFFEPPIFHPNVSEFGLVSSPYLSMWRQYSVREMIVSLLCLLENPYMSAANNEVAKVLYHNNYSAFCARANANVLHEHNNNGSTDDCQQVWAEDSQ